MKEFRKTFTTNNKGHKLLPPPPPLNTNKYNNINTTGSSNNSCNSSSNSNSTKNSNDEKDMKKQLQKPRMDDCERMGRREKDRLARQNLNQTPEHPPLPLFPEPVRLSPSEGDNHISATLGEFSKVKPLIESKEVYIGIATSNRRPHHNSNKYPPNPLIGSSQQHPSLQHGGTSALNNRHSSSLAAQQQSQLQSQHPSSGSYPQPPPPYSSSQSRSSSSSSGYLKQQDSKTAYNGRGGYPGQSYKHEPPGSNTNRMPIHKGSSHNQSQLPPPPPLSNGRPLPADKSGSGSSGYPMPHQIPNGRYPQSLQQKPINKYSHHPEREKDPIMNGDVDQFHKDIPTSFNATANPDVVGKEKVNAAPNKYSDYTSRFKSTHSNNNNTNVNNHNSNFSNDSNIKKNVPVSNNKPSFYNSADDSVLRKDLDLSDSENDEDIKHRKNASVDQMSTNSSDSSDTASSESGSEESNGTKGEPQNQPNQWDLRNFFKQQEQSQTQQQDQHLNKTPLSNSTTPQQQNNCILPSQPIIKAEPMSGEDEAGPPSPLPNLTNIKKETTEIFQIGKQPTNILSSDFPDNSHPTNQIKFEKSSSASPNHDDLFDDEKSNHSTSFSAAKTLTNYGNLDPSDIINTDLSSSSDDYEFEQPQQPSQQQSLKQHQQKSQQLENQQRPQNIQPQHEQKQIQSIQQQPQQQLNVLQSSPKPAQKLNGPTTSILPNRISSEKETNSRPTTSPNKRPVKRRNKTNNVMPDTSDDEDNNVANKSNKKHKTDSKEVKRKPGRPKKSVTPSTATTSTIPTATTARGKKNDNLPQVTSPAANQCPKKVTVDRRSSRQSVTKSRAYIDSTGSSSSSESAEEGELKSSPKKPLPVDSAVNLSNRPTATLSANLANKNLQQNTHLNQSKKNVHLQQQRQPTTKRSHSKDDSDDDENDSDDDDDDDDSDNSSSSSSDDSDDSDDDEEDDEKDEKDLNPVPSGDHVNNESNSGLLSKRGSHSSPVVALTTVGAVNAIPPSTVTGKKSVHKNTSSSSSSDDDDDDDDQSGSDSDDSKSKKRDKPKSDKNKNDALKSVFIPVGGSKKSIGQVLISEESNQQKEAHEKILSPINAFKSTTSSSTENIAAASNLATHIHHEPQPLHQTLILQSHNQQQQQQKIASPSITVSPATTQNVHHQQQQQQSSIVPTLLSSTNQNISSNSNISNSKSNLFNMNNNSNNSNNSNNQNLHQPQQQQYHTKHSHQQKSLKSPRNVNSNKITTPPIKTPERTPTQQLPSPQLSRTSQSPQIKPTIHSPKLRASRSPQVKSTLHSPKLRTAASPQMKPILSPQLKIIPPPIPTTILSAAAASKQQEFSPKGGRLFQEFSPKSASFSTTGLLKQQTQQQDILMPGTTVPITASTATLTTVPVSLPTSIICSIELTRICIKREWCKNKYRIPGRRDRSISPRQLHNKSPGNLNTINTMPGESINDTNLNFVENNRLKGTIASTLPRTSGILNSNLLSSSPHLTSPHQTTAITGVLLSTANDSSAIQNLHTSTPPAAALDNLNKNHENCNTSNSGNSGSIGTNVQSANNNSNNYPSKYLANTSRLSGSYNNQERQSGCSILENVNNSNNNVDNNYSSCSNNSNKLCNQYESPGHIVESSIISNKNSSNNNGYISPIRPPSITGGSGNSRLTPIHRAPLQSPKTEEPQRLLAASPSNSKLNILQTNIKHEAGIKDELDEYSSSGANGNNSNLKTSRPPSSMDEKYNLFNVKSGHSNGSNASFKQELIKNEIKLKTTSPPVHHHITTTTTSSNSTSSGPNIAMVAPFTSSITTGQVAMQPHSSHAGNINSSHISVVTTGNKTGIVGSQANIIDGSGSILSGAGIGGNGLNTDYTLKRKKRTSSSSSSPYKEKKKRKDKGSSQDVMDDYPPTNHDRLHQQLQINEKILPPTTQPQVVISKVYRSYFEHDDASRDKDNALYGDKKYLEEAKRLKHAADKETNLYEQLMLYLEAVLYFLLSSAELEEHKNTEKAACTMYQETLLLIKYISSKLRNPQNSQFDNHNKVAILSLRCQSLISSKLYKMKRYECREVQRMITEYFSQRNSTEMLNGNTPSSISPTNSNGSQGSGSTTPPSLNIPSQVLHALEKQNMFFNYLTSCHDLWDQADTLVKKGNHTDFFIALDHENGPLTLHSSIYDVFKYVQAGLRKLKD